MENRFLSQNMKYFAYFTLCEILNLVAILVNFHITNCFLDGKFLTYGLEVITYMNGIPKSQLVDPRCNVFPTLVSTNYTVWKSQYFSVIQILCEINFGES